jgi:hypothetical protein
MAGVQIPERAEQATGQRPPPARRSVHLALRWMLGLTLVATALGKALDVSGFRNVLRDYDLFPVWSLWLIALAMPLIEAGIAATMLTGRWLRAGILASGLLHGSFAVVLTVELLRGVDLQNCGCFGVFLARPLTWFSPLEDLALVAITLAIAATIDGGFFSRKDAKPQEGSRV